MDLTCRCKGFYTCVACRVKRGDYRDWMLVEENECADCGEGIGPRSTYCRPCYHRRYYAGTLRRTA